jgi:hypothetical protein
MFRALLAYLQEALRKQRLVYCVLFGHRAPKDEQVVLETCIGC